MKDAIVGLLRRLHLYGLFKFYKRVKNRIFKIITLRIIFPRAYYKNAKKPINPNKVVFIEVRLPEITNSFKLLYDKLITEYDYEIHSHFLRNTFVPMGEYVRRCKDMMEDIATAKYVFVNEASDVVSCVNMRKETIVTQTWHGCGAFKKFGFSTAELIFGESKKEMLRFPFYKNYTHVTLSSPEIAWAYEEAMNLHDNKQAIKPIGTSRTDVFYDDKFIEDSFKKLYAFMPTAKGKKIILYAPTFRGRVANGKTPNMLNVKMFKEELSEEYVLLIKHHPLVRKPPAIPESCMDFASDLSDAMSIEELLAISDICISDYSSLVFEYSLYERPLIFFSYDLSEYFDWRGFYYDYNELAPGPVFKTNLEMIDYIKNIDTRFDKARVHAFREKFMSSCDGKATERLMQTVFGEDLQHHLREKPLLGEYHGIPNADTLYSDRLARIKSLEELSQKANALYSKLSTGDVDKNNLVMLYRRTRSAALRKLKRALKGKAEVTRINVDKTSLKDTVSAIANAGCIVLSEPIDIVNVLKIRPETKVVQLWDKVFPLEKFGYSTKAVESGLEDDLLKASPLHNNYTLVPTASEALGEVYKEAFGVDNDVIEPLGNATTDVLFDKKFKKKAYDKFLQKFPYAKDKKIIFYLHEPRTTLTRPTAEVFVDYRDMNEYLSRDYVLVYYWKRAADAKPLPLSKFFTEFMVNMYGEMSVEELMSIADIMIGDYKEETFTFAVTGRPIFLYAPDYKTYFFKADSYFEYEQIAPGPIFEDAHKLTQAIVNVDSYDDSKREAFCKKFLANCDGKATERIVNSILK